MCPAPKSSSVAAFVGIMWKVEPIFYGPVLGVCGTYMSFLARRMRMPVVITRQSAIEAETGSAKAELAAVIGIAVSVLVRLICLFALILIGAALIAVLPAAVADAINADTLPALYGAVWIMFMKSAAGHDALTGLAAGVIIFLSPTPKILAQRQRAV